MITTLATLCAILAFALLMAAAVTLGESGCGRGRVLGGATPKKWNYILSENKPDAIVEEARPYTDREGNQRASLEVRALTIKFVGNRTDQGDGEAATARNAQKTVEKRLNTRDEDIPF